MGMASSDDGTAIYRQHAIDEKLDGLAQYGPPRGDYGTTESEYSRACRQDARRRVASGLYKLLDEQERAYWAGCDR